MITRKRFFDPKVFVDTRFLLFAAFLLLVAISCSKGHESPMTPPTTNDQPVNLNLNAAGIGHGHKILGYATVHFDTISGIAEMSFNRTLEAHINLTSFLNNAGCPGSQCLTWHVTGHDTSTNIWFIDMNLINPTAFAPYDLRIIFAGLPGDASAGTAWVVANPDSYTNVWDPDQVVWDSTKIGTWMNPFIAFEKSDYSRQFPADPDGNGPKISSHTEQLQMMIPAGAPNGDITLIIDGCLPGHCNDPYQIFNASQTGVLPASDSTSAVYFETIVADWQLSAGTNESALTDVSLYMPDLPLLTTGTYVPLTKVNPSQWPRTIDPQEYDPGRHRFLYSIR